MADKAGGRGGRVLTQAVCEPRSRHSTHRKCTGCVWSGAGSNPPRRMAVYLGPRLQVYLRETGLLPFIFIFSHVSSFAFLKKRSWQLEKPGGFSQQLSSTARRYLLVENGGYFFFLLLQTENNMPLFEHQEGPACLLLRRGSRGSKPWSEFLRNSYLAGVDSLSGSGCGQARAP